MEEIRRLQRQLKQSQAKSNRARLSDRTVVDLVRKLTEGGFKLFVSTSREYLTPEQVDREIREAVASAGGRLAVSDLPQLLGVGVESLEPRLGPLAKREGWTTLAGELLAHQYVQSVQTEVDQLLLQRGCVQVSELAMRFGLPAEYLRTHVLPGSSRQLREGVLYTDAYLRTVAARVRGTLAAVTTPMSAAALAKQYSVGEDFIGQEMQKVAASPFVKGTYAGRTFTPTRFVTAQSDKVTEFFAANGYVEYALARSVGIAKPQEWLRKNETGTALETVFVAPHLLSPLAAAVRAAVVGGGWVDLATLVPPAFAHEDVLALLPLVEPDVPFVAAGTAVLSAAAVDGWADGFDAKAKAAAAGGG